MQFENRSADVLVTMHISHWHCKYVCKAVYRCVHSCLLASLTTDVCSNLDHLGWDAGMGLEATLTTLMTTSALCPTAQTSQAPCQASLRTWSTTSTTPTRPSAVSLSSLLARLAALAAAIPGACHTAPGTAAVLYPSFSDVALPCFYSKAAVCCFCCNAAVFGSIRLFNTVVLWPELVAL